MKHSIIGSDKGAFIKRLNAERTVCIVAACVALVLNVIFTVFRNDQNHTLFLWLNIAIDILLGWFLIFFISMTVAPKKRLLQLYNSKKSSLEGTVGDITEDTRRVRHFDCFAVTLLVEDGERQFFLPADTPLTLSKGERVRISAVSGIIVEAVQ